jgi:hypothetical protein
VRDDRERAHPELIQADQVITDLEQKLAQARRELDRHRAKARTWEHNAGQAVDLANRELRKRQEAYAKLDILMREYRQIAMTLCDVLSDDARQPWADRIGPVTEAFLERLSEETGKLAPGGNGEDSDTKRADTVDGGLADRGAGGTGATPDRLRRDEQREPE